MKPPPDSKAQRTTQHILEKAAPVFNKRGFAGTTLADITAATGLTKGGIYGNFQNKDELACRAFDHNLQRVVSFIWREMHGETTVVGQLMAYPRAYRKIFRELSDLGGCPILNTAVDADDTHPELHRLALAAIDRWRNGLMNLVRRGQANGEIRAEVEPARVAETIISLVEGGSAMAKATGRVSFMMHALDQIESLISASRA
ncbi:MAG: TetR/AcrR family transcriptional regulator [Deltaproteobacteria bacterium]|nr:TetR/AcrR family transcriptional regulator [Deltaproteobacteria bacterium]